jgi:protein-S-isoprenylcysteine O-methyltransferase Ste14
MTPAPKSGNPFDFDGTRDSAFEEALDTGNEPVRAPMSVQEREIRKQVHRLAEFYRHALTYVCVIGLLWVICLLTLRQFNGHWWSYWAIWPTLGWGIGLFFHGLSVMPRAQSWGRDWEERKVRELMARESALRDRANFDRR